MRGFTDVMIENKLRQEEVCVWGVSACGCGPNRVQLLGFCDTETFISNFDDLYQMCISLLLQYL